MAKLKLSYVTVFDRYLFNQNELEEVTRSLARSGSIKFQPESEVIHFGRDPHGLNSLWMCVVPVNKGGGVDHTGCYSNRDSKFYPRTRDNYLKLSKKGHQLFPIVTPEEREAGSNPEMPFELSRGERRAFMWLMSTYERANPDPFPRVAVVTSTNEYRDDVMQKFLSLAMKVGEPLEIKPCDMWRI